jgi:phage antirepressor YoqD-like protein
MFVICEFQYLIRDSQTFHASEAKNSIQTPEQTHVNQNVFEVSNESIKTGGNIVSVSMSLPQVGKNDQNFKSVDIPENDRFKIDSSFLIFFE